MPFKIVSASISTARNAAAVSVVKYGFPVPPPKITTLFFSKCLMALLLIYGSAICYILIAVCNLVSIFKEESADCKAIPLIIVASIPI